MRRIACRLLAATLLIVFLSPGPAIADDWGTLMTPTRPLNVRLDRSPKAGKVKTLRPGDVVRVDFLKDGWYAVFDPQETERDVAKALGYSKASYLKPASGTSSGSSEVSESADWGEIMVVTAPMLNVRTGRGPKYQHVRTLYEGDLVKVDFAAGSWVAVFEPDAPDRKESAAIGYTNGKYLKPPTQAQLAALADKADLDEGTAQPQPQAQAQPEPEPLPAAGSDWGEIMRLSSKVEILQEPDSGAKVVATLLVGDVIKVLKVSGDWYRAYLPQEMDPDPVHALGWVTQEQLGDTGREVTAESITAAVQEPAPEPAPEPEPEVAPEPAPEPEPAMESEPGPAATDDEKVNPILEQMAQDDAKADNVQTDDPQEDAVNTVREQADTNPLPPLDESEEPGQGDEAAVWDEDAPDTATSTFTASAESVPQEYEITVPEYVEGEPQQGREPVADKEAHGFQYAVLAKSGTEPFAKTMTIGVYLDVTVVPGADSLRDFAATVWKKEGKPDKNVVVDIFLPGQDLRSLSYVTATFDTRGPVEFWTRETTLYGTRFK